MAAIRLLFSGLKPQTGGDCERIARRHMDASIRVSTIGLQARQSAKSGRNGEGLGSGGNGVACPSSEVVVATESLSCCALGLSDQDAQDVRVFAEVVISGAVSGTLQDHCR